LGRGLVFAALGGGAGTVTAFDATLHGNDGTLTNMDPATDWVDVPELGRKGLDFDDTNSEYVNIPTLPIGSYPAFTLHAWLPATSYLARTVDYWRNYVNSGTYVCVCGYGNAFQFNCRNNFDATAAITLASSASGLYAVTAVRHSLSHHAIYLDGTLAGEDIAHTVSGLFTQQVTTIGDIQGIAVDHMCWDRALSRHEIAALADKSNVNLSLGGQDAIWTPQRSYFYSAAKAGGAAPAGQPVFNRFGNVPFTYGYRNGSLRYG